MARAAKPWLAPAATFCLALGLYLLKLQPDISWANYGGDGGELIAATVTLGLPHPPGYPTYVWLGKLFSLLPLLPIARLFHLFSALLAAASAATVTATMGNRNMPTAVLAGLLVATAPLVWGQAVIAEVYTLNLLVVSLWLYWWWRRPQAGGWLGFWAGLSLTTHLTSLLLLPLTFWRVPRAQWGRLGGAILLGLTPYLTVPWLGRPESVISWGEPQTISGFASLISGRLYQHQVLALPPAEWLLRLGAWWPILLAHGILLGWFSLPWVWRQTPPENRPPILALSLAGLAYLGYAFLYDSADAIVFALPAIPLLSIPLTTVWQRWPRAAWMLPLLAVTLNFSYPPIKGQSVEPNNLRAVTVPILDKLPADTLVTTPGDPTIFTLWYFQLAEKQRPDLIIVDQNLFGFDWYRARLQRHYPELRGLGVNDWPAFLAANETERAVCAIALASDQPLFCPNLSDVAP